MQDVKGRYAPSPTGQLHLGNARTALLAWLHTRVHGGAHLLRLEDLDTGRVRPGAADSIKQDLLWLGLDWDAEYRQSTRLSHYQRAVERLSSYPCTCTRREIMAATEASVSAPHDMEAVYPGTCAAGGQVPGRPAALRWRVPSETICVDDTWTRQRVCQHLPSEVGDFILRRSDGAFAYHLAVVVDDAEMGITDVVRGQDLLRATPRQVALQRALGYFTPRYYHVPLLSDSGGVRLSKRMGSVSVAYQRASGLHAPQVLAQLGRSLGWALAEHVSLDELLTVYQHKLRQLV